MERRSITGILLIPVIGVLLLVLANGAISNGIAWAQAGPGVGRDGSVLLAISLTIGASVVAIGGVALVFRLTTGRKVWETGQVTRSATELKQRLDSLEPSRRKVMLLLSAPGFLVLDVGLGYLSWAITTSNLSLLSAGSKSSLLMPALVGLVLTLLGLICLVGLQLGYVRWALRGRSPHDNSLPQ